MTGITDVLAPLAAALGLSLLVERILELAQNLMERVLRLAPGRMPPDSAASEGMIEELARVRREEQEATDLERRAEEWGLELRQRQARLAEAEDPERRAELQAEVDALRRKLSEESTTAWEERVPTATLLVEPATDPGESAILKPFVLQLLGMAAGIVLARQADLHLFGRLLESAGSTATLLAWQDNLLTGLLIGGGSGPIHVLIRFLGQRKIHPLKPAAAEAREPAPAGEGSPKPVPAAPQGSHGPAFVVPAAPPADTGDWVDIPYRGGVDRERLETVHLRAAEPDLILYHSTAMHSASTFEDVVRVIRSRTDPRGEPWLTAYNCVVTRDGAVHPFCRWDRYGNHAAGFNRRSLAIAFNGNFETDPRVPFSNSDGRYGEARPSEVQLRAGARVIALWSLLYDIPPDFGSTVLPHDTVAARACPGSGFPHRELRRWVEHYVGRWERSSHAQERIAAFRLKPYLFAEGGAR